MKCSVFCCLSVALGLSPMFLAAETVPDLSGYHTVKDAITTKVHEAAAERGGQAGYLGVSVARAGGEALVIDEVALDSPAQKAGLHEGDKLVSIDGKPVVTTEALRDTVQAHAPGDVIPLTVQRGAKRIDASATLEALSRPLDGGESRAVLGLRMGTPTDAPGIAVSGITPDLPAAKAGLRLGDVILKVDDAELGEGLSLTDKLSEYKSGQKVKLTVRRGGKELVKEIELAAADGGFVPPEEQRNLKPWKKDTYRLGVICVEFSDVKHNAKVPREEWERMFFSRDAYNTTNATGQKVYGSMADYYHEASCGKLRVEGRVFDWVSVSKPRADYNLQRGSIRRTAFFNEIVEAVLKRDGKDALKDLDGLGIVYAGERFPEANRSSLLWPHRFSVKIKDKTWPYVIVAAGSERMTTISTMCHETGHILGLPDLYERPENPGSEGVGTWCIMSNQFLNGRPQHFSAWSKEQLGWLHPTVIDPTVKQKLILAPVEGSDAECFKILVRPDGSEYFLLENRRKTGFDSGLAAEGLLIWRVVANRPILEESHGITGPSGPRVHLRSVPFPSKSNNAFTPYTTPSSRAQLAGGASAFITNIRQLNDGRITFEIGREFD